MSETQSKTGNPQSEILETTFHVRFAETDLMGIVHHSAYIVWMEEGRSDFMRRRGFTFDQWEAANIGFAVSEVNVRYHAPARYGERVTVRTCVESLRSRQIVFGYEIINADSGQQLVTGRVNLIAVDKAGNVRTIPAQALQALSGAR
jgi:acyl-CoA thioester hydrolase